MERFEELLASVGKLEMKFALDGDPSKSPEEEFDIGNEFRLKYDETGIQLRVFRQYFTIFCLNFLSNLISLNGDFTPNFLHLLHQNICFFYTKLFAFFTPKFLHFLQQNFCIFTPNYLFFYTKLLAFFTPNFWHFLHQKFFFFYTNFLLHQNAFFFYTNFLH